MKKALLSTIILCGVVLLVTGCQLGGKKTLSCDQSTSGVDINITTNFEANKIKTMSLSYAMDLSTYSDAQIKAIEGQDFCKSVKSAMTGMDKAFGNCKQNIENKKLSVIASIDVSKLEGFDISEKSTFKDVKESLESTKFKCSEK